MATSAQQSVGIFTTDTQLVVRSWDAWLANVTGMLSHIVRGVNLIELFPELESRGLQNFFQQTLREGSVVKLSPPTHPYLIPCMLQWPSKHFEYMQQAVTIAPLRDRDRIIGTIVTIEDISQQYERECDLTELNLRLKSPDETTRLQAVQLLATQDPGEAGGLFEVLADKSWQVRQVAVSSLIQRGGSQAIASLVQRIQKEHQDFSLLNSALKALSQIEGDIVTPLSQLLQMPDEDLRGYAALALGEQNDRRAIPALMAALNDSNTNVRYNAVEALGKLGAVEAVGVLADLIESGDFFLAFPALESLKKIGEPSIAPRMVNLLTDDVLCEPAIETLGQLGDESVVAPLVQLLNEREDLVLPVVRTLTTLYERYDELYGDSQRIANQIRHFMNEQGVHNLLSHLDQVGKTELRSFALVLGCLEGEIIEYTLARLIGTEESSVQTEILHALVRYGPRVVHLLIEQLKSNNVETCQATIYALGKIRDKQAIPALIPFLKGEHEALTIAAIESLTKIGDPEIYPDLLELLGHANNTVRYAAIAALNALNPPGLVKQLIVLLQDFQALKRESAAKIVGYLGCQEAFDPLLKCCEDEVETVCQAAIEALPCFDSPLVMTHLHHALLRGSPKVRASAARALALIEAEEVQHDLCTALKDTDSWVRYFAARSLGQQGAISALEPLSLLAMADPANHVRIAAITAIGQLDCVQAVPLLTLMSQLPNADLVQAAIAALGNIHHPDALLPLLTTIHSGEPAYRLKALQALRSHPRIEVIEALQRIATTEESVEFVDAVLKVLAEMATAESINALISLMIHPKRRQHCIELLAQLNEVNIELVAEGLKHKHIGVRLAIVEVLARMKHPLATQHLLAVLKDDEAVLRLTAVTCLGELEPHGLKQRLLEVVRTDHNLAVRRAAEKALHMGDDLN